MTENANKSDIDAEMKLLDECVEKLADLITNTNVNMLDDSAGTLDVLKSKLTQAKNELDTARSNLSSYNNTLKNNAHEEDWYLKYNGWNG